MKSLTFIYNQRKIIAQLGTRMSTILAAGSANNYIGCFL